MTTKKGKETDRGRVHKGEEGKEHAGEIKFHLIHVLDFVYSVFLPVVATALTAAALSAENVTPFLSSF